LDHHLSPSFLIVRRDDLIWMQQHKLSEGDTDLRALTDEVHARLDAGDTALNTAEIAAAKGQGPTRR